MTAFHLRYIPYVEAFSVGTYTQHKIIGGVNSVRRQTEWNITFNNAE
jgi:hypothetical protein